MLRPNVSKKALFLPWLALAMGLGPMIAASAASDDRDSTSREAQHVAQSTQFSDKQIESFAEARQSVMEISSEWQERLNNAESQEKLNSLQAQVQEEMVQAVRDEGLSVNDYNMMVDAVQTNPELQNRVRELMMQ